MKKRYECYEEYIPGDKGIDKYFCSYKSYNMPEYFKCLKDNNLINSPDKCYQTTIYADILKLYKYLSPNLEGT